MNNYLLTLATDLYDAIVARIKAHYTAGEVPPDNLLRARDAAERAMGSLMPPITGKFNATLDDNTIGGVYPPGTFKQG